MINYIIFDLSEVLISGIVGIEKDLAHLLPMPPNQILECFGGDNLTQICLGNKTEEDFLHEAINQGRWQISTEKLKQIIRQNFHKEFDGTIPLLYGLSEKYKLILHSDHAREWIEYIKEIHPFLSVFERLFFSYDIGFVKKNTQSFEAVLEKLAAEPDDCLFIDDNPVNVDAAKSVGINGICFRDVIRLRQELEKRRVL